MIEEYLKDEEEAEEHKKEKLRKKRLKKKEKKKMIKKTQAEEEEEEQRRKTKEKEEQKLKNKERCAPKNAKPQPFKEDILPPKPNTENSNNFCNTSNLKNRVLDDGNDGLFSEIKSNSKIFILYLLSSKSLQPIREEQGWKSKSKL